MHTRLATLLSAHFELLNPARYRGTTFSYSGFECGDGYALVLADFGSSLLELSPKELVIYEVSECPSCLYISAECEPTLNEQFDQLIYVTEQKSAGICGSCGEHIYLPIPSHKCHGRVVCLGAKEMWLIEHIQELHHERNPESN